MADVDYFLDSEDIAGEDLDETYTNKIRLLNFSLGVTNQGSMGFGSGGGKGRAERSDLHFEKVCDCSTPNWFQAASSGRHLDCLDVIARKAGGDAPAVFLTIHFNDCYVSGYNLSGSSGGIVPTESISINYASVTFEYAKQKDTGDADAPATLGWDFAANKKL